MQHALQYIRVVFALHSARTHTLFKMMCINEHIFCVLYIFFSFQWIFHYDYWCDLWAQMSNHVDLFIFKMCLPWLGLACLQLQLQLQRNYFDATTFPNHFTINCPFFCPRQNILYERLLHSATAFCHLAGLWPKFHRFSMES